MDGKFFVRARMRAKHCYKIPKGKWCSLQAMGEQWGGTCQIKSLVVMNPCYKGDACTCIINTKYCHRRMDNAIY